MCGSGHALLGSAVRGHHAAPSPSRHHRHELAPASRRARPVVFSSSLFLLAFLPAFLLAYYAAPSRLRNAIALLGSLYFYAWGAPAFVFVLLAGTAIDYWLAQRVHAAAERRAARRWLQLSLLLNIGLLLWFKYANFGVAQLDAALALFGVSPLPWTKIALPIGISFFTFQKISYVVDVYRGTAQPARSFADCLLYVVLFPQLIAGPIVRYHDVDQQIRQRSHGSGQFWSGVQRFTVGLAKKALLANAMASLCDPIYALPVETVPVECAWLAAIAYYFQIYFDFSGYSDMAIGLGRMMGFEFLENFDRPYVARTFTEFWRRWHMSLSNFMREYVYIPLGGNRVRPLRAYLNLWIVFLVSGFWHGASWNFVVWGGYQGLFLTIDKLGFAKVAARLPALVLRPAMVLLVVVSWVLFRGNDLTHSAAMLSRMFGGGGPDLVDSPLSHQLVFDGCAKTQLAIAAVVAFLPWSRRYLGLEQRFLQWARGGGLGSIVRDVLVWLLLLLALLAVVNSTHNPFIYYRF
jgi:alginate O-acetyltransferase complex protein AlgI